MALISLRIMLDIRRPICYTVAYDRIGRASAEGLPIGASTPMPYLHDWIPSMLGHGNTMCRRCYMTDMEAIALRCQYVCDVSPISANDNNSKRSATTPAK